MSNPALPCPLPPAARSLTTPKRQFGPAIAAAAILHAALLFAVPTRDVPEFEAFPTLPINQDPVPVPIPEETVPVTINSDDHTDQSKLAKKGVSDAIPDPGVGAGTKNSVEIRVDTEALKPDVRLGPFKDKGILEGLPSETGPGIAPIDAKSLDRQPEIISQIAPRFPEALKREYTAGTVRAQFIVDREGRVVSVQILSSTHAAFGEAVEKAVLRWRFKAGWKNNRPVASRMEQVFAFKVE
ncbi:MAG: TonB family protein [Opitutaceae bacterium]|nr:TonB family protein [Opitutaceae bacterium]